MAPPKALPLRFFPDPILVQKCEPILEVTEEIRTLAQDMLLTMMVERGLGLAAPQVGKLLRLFVADVEWADKQEGGDSQSYVFINPTVEIIGDTVNSVEGCLSFPGEKFEQARSKQVRITATDLEGNSFTVDAIGVLAVVIQHEYDHLDGKTGASKLSWLKRDMLRKKCEKARRFQKKLVPARGR